MAQPPPKCNLFRLLPTFELAYPPLAHRFSPPLASLYQSILTTRCLANRPSPRTTVKPPRALEIAKPRPRCRGNRLPTLHDSALRSLFDRDKSPPSVSSVPDETYLPAPANIPSSPAGRA
ncbi:hypothetical protein KM043_003687 [Ampulex compressa]|nr:hypothetical protein KM043_003687 [Ampulex compressa]